MEQLSFFSFPGKVKKTALMISNSFIYQNIHVTLVRKSYQRNMYLSVRAGGEVKISCSRGASLKEIQCFLGKHWQWVQKRISEQKRMKKKYPVKKFRIGETFLFRGEVLKLKYEFFCVNGKSFTTEHPFPFFYIKKGELIYCWNKAEDLNKDVLNKKLRNFYEAEGRKILSSVLSYFSDLMGLTPSSVRIGSQKSLWGSCSSAGDISLNWRLVAAPPEVLNYVVIHELAHVQHLNHSNAFWSLVFQFCPLYKKQERWLKHCVYAMDFLLPRSELHSF